MKPLKSLLLIAALSAAQAFATLATDDFESSTLSGGTGAWTGPWTHAGAGGAFVDGGSQIDGTFSGALFTSGAGTAVLSRSFTPINTVGADVQVAFTLSGLANGNEIGVNILGLKSNASTTVLTLKFTGSGSGFTLNDGGADFVAAPAVTYANGADYDIVFSGEIGSTDYFWSVSQRGGGSANNGTAFTYSGARRLVPFPRSSFSGRHPQAVATTG